MTNETPANGFRTFLIIWVTQSISMIGSMITYFALTIWATQVLYPLPEQKPELGMALAAMSIAFGIPAVVLAPIAGAWVDRHDRRLTMLTADLLMMLIAGTMTALIMTGSLQLWSLVVLLAALASVNTFHGAAFDTSYVMLVPNQLLPRANGMMQTAWSAAGVLSPMLAAAVIALPGIARGAGPGPLSTALASLADGTALVTGLDTISFAVSALVLAFLRIPSPKRADLDPTGKPKKSIWADVREGALFVFRRPSLLWLLASFTVANFCLSAMGVLMPMIVKFNLADSLAGRGLSVDQAIGQLGSIAGVGGVIGGLLVSFWGGLKQNRVRGVIGPMLLAGAAELFYGLSTSLYLTAAMAFIIQFTMPVTNAHSTAIWQSQTPREMQGRVFSVRRLIAWVANPVATAMAGLLGGLLNPGSVVAVLGGLFAAFSLLQFFNRSLMRAEEAPPLAAGFTD